MSESRKIEYEKGFWIHLPCKVSDIVYRIKPGRLETVEELYVTKVLAILDDNNNVPMIRIDCISQYSKTESSYLEEHIGRYVFSKKEDAEKNLNNSRNV